MSIINMYLKRLHEQNVKERAFSGENNVYAADESYVGIIRITRSVLNLGKRHVWPRKREKKGREVEWRSNSRKACRFNS
jgi:uncharacterized membrane protein YkgB